MVRQRNKRQYPLDVLHQCQTRRLVHHNYVYEFHPGPMLPCVCWDVSLWLSRAKPMIIQLIYPRASHGRGDTNLVIPTSPVIGNCWEVSICNIKRWVNPDQSQQYKSTSKQHNLWLHIPHRICLIFNAHIQISHVPRRSLRLYPWHLRQVCSPSSWWGHRRHVVRQQCRLSLQSAMQLLGKLRTSAPTE